MDELLQRWDRLETHQFGKGVLPLGGTSDERFYLAHYDAWNAYAGEALLRTEHLNPLLKLRGLLFRGRFEEAKPLIEELGASFKSSGSQAAISELLLEQARYECFLRNWEQALESAQTAMALSPAAVTYLGLLQVRALAHYELGEFQKSVRDLSEMDSLGTCLPHSFNLLYGHAIRARIQVRDGGEGQARRVLGELWKSALPKLNADSLLTLLRTEIDVARVLGKPHFSLALASYLVAHAMGDRLYIALAALDIHLSAPSAGNGTSELLERERTDFPQILGLLAEAQAPWTSTGRGIHAFVTSQATQPSDESVLAAIESLPAIERVVLPKLGVVAHLGRGQTADAILIRARPMGASHLRAILALGRGPLTKEVLLKEVWQVKTYSKDLHDSTLRTLVSRLRKNYGLPITTSNGRIQIENTWVVGSEL